MCWGQYLDSTPLCLLIWLLFLSCFSLWAGGVLKRLKGREASDSVNGSCVFHNTVMKLKYDRFGLFVL